MYIIRVEARENFGIWLPKGDIYHIPIYKSRRIILCKMVTGEIFINFLLSIVFR